MKKDRVKILIAAAESTSHKALANALAKHAEVEALKEENKLLVQFKAASTTLAIAVEALIAVRKDEKSIKARVTSMDAALEQFKIDGDYEVLRASYKKAGWVVYNP